MVLKERYHLHPKARSRLVRLSVERSNNCWTIYHISKTWTKLELQGVIYRCKVLGHEWLKNSVIALHFLRLSIFHTHTNIRPFALYFPHCSVCVVSIVQFSLILWPSCLFKTWNLKSGSNFHYGMTVTTISGTVFSTTHHQVV